MKKSILSLFRNAILAFVLLLNTDSYAAFRISRPSADVRQQALMSLQDAGPIENYPLQSTTGEDPFTVDFSELGVVNPTNAYVLLINEETGNAVELSVVEETDTKLAIPPLAMAELEMEYLGANRSYRCMTVVASETGDDEVVDIQAVATSVGTVEMPNFNYRNNLGEVQKTTVGDRRLTSFSKVHPTFCLYDPDAPNTANVLAELAERESYFVYSYELPDGNEATYSVEGRRLANDEKSEHLSTPNVEFRVTYSSTTPTAAKTAFSKAVSLWSEILGGTQPIYVHVDFRSLDPNVLGSTSAGVAKFSDGVYRVYALADQIADMDVAPEYYDIQMQFNTDFKWYYGTDGHPGYGQQDLVSVLLHELCHGLGFSDSVDQTTGKYYYGTGECPTLFDTYLYYNGSRITSLSASQRKAALTSDALYFDGPNAKAANGGNRIAIFAPETYNQGSTGSHWDWFIPFQDSTFMRYAYAYPFHEFTAIKRGTMKDLGWDVAGTVPAAPTGLTASKGTLVGKIRLQWTASSGASSYAVYMSPSANGTYSQIGSGLTSCSCNVNVSDTRTYYFKVAGVNLTGQTGPLSDFDYGSAKSEDRTLSRIEITGAATLPQDAYADYTCTAYYSDGTSSDVSSSTTWTVPYGSIYITQSGRRLTSLWVSESKTATLRAQYGGKTAEFTVTILPQRPVPGNDSFTSPELIAGTSGQKTGGNAGATMESGERKPQAREKSTGSVWFKWTAPSSGTATFDTMGSAFDTVLGIYTGASLSSLSEIGSNDDIATGNTMSRVEFRAVSGTTYRIAIYGYNGANGSYKLNWTLENNPGPSNDPFSVPITLAGASGRKTGTNTAASMETSERIPQAQSLSTGSVWYKWTAPSSGTVSFDTIGSGFDTVLGVYTGSSVSSISEVGSDDDGGGNRTSKVTFSAVSGTTYRIAIYGYSGASGSFNLQWKMSSPAPSLAPVHRFYSKNYKGHFYTIDEAEKNSLIATNPNWKYEGIAYYAYTEQTSGTVPLYRFYSKAYRGHFFTIDEAEMRTVRDTNPNWKYEGVAYYVRPTTASGASPIYRFWSKGYRHHFYTMDYEEMVTLRDTNPNWKYETVAFYAWSSQSTSLVSAPKTANKTEKPAKDADIGTGETGKGEFRIGIDRFVVPGEGAFPVELFTLVVQSETPDSTELAWSHFASGGRDAPILALRIALPAGEASLWSAADGEQETGPIHDGVLDFDLPVDGVWHWLRATDESGNESVSVWLRALAD